MSRYDVPETIKLDNKSQTGLNGAMKKTPFVLTVLFVSVCFFTAVPARAQQIDGPSPDSIMCLTGNFSAQCIPEVLNALASPDERVKTEALLLLSNVADIPELFEPKIYEAVIDALNDSSDSVKIQALKTLTSRFSDIERVREVLDSLPGKLFPLYLHPWVRAMVENAKKTDETEDLISSISVNIRDLIKEKTGVEGFAQAVQAAEGFLGKHPEVIRVEVSDDILWFTIRGGYESGILLTGFEATASESQQPQKKW